MAVEADLVDVGSPEALLHRRRQERRRLLAPEEIRHLRLHPGRREQRGVILGTRNQGPGREPLVPFGFEEREKALAQLGGGAHATDSTFGLGGARTASSPPGSDPYASK